MHIPYFNLKAVNASFEPELSAAINRVVDSGHYLHGEETARFEAEFAGYIGTRHCVGVANGLDALTLILLSLKQLHGWTEENEVIVPAMTFFATLAAVQRAGLRPVLCDVHPDGGMDAEAAEAVITANTRVLLPVHLYGRIADMYALNVLAKKHELFLVEDAAQAHGAHYDGKHAGNFGTAAAFSFYPAKNLGALGDGGAVCTNHTELAERVRTLANYGAPQKYRHEYFGCNSRLDELQAAVLRVKLRRLDMDNARRCDIAAMLDTAEAPLVTHPCAAQERKRNVYHIYPLLCERREGLAAHMRRQGVETLIHYPLPLHLQPAAAGLLTGDFPVAERIAREEISLPMSPLLTQEEVVHIIESINSFHT